MKKLQNFWVNGIIPIFTMLLLLIASATSDCQLPSTWRGTWFQQEHFETTRIKIDNSSINLSLWDPDNHFVNRELLGSCVKKDEDLYIFVDNISGNCTKCVIIKDLDTNVLNYRHTDCLDDGIDDIDTSSVKDLCTGLHNVDMDYYLIRDPFTPVPCPFRNEAFLFSYGKELNKDAVCPSNKSHTETCYDDTQLVFKYEACNDMNYEAKVEEIQCVGAWKDVDHKYFIATVMDSQRLRYVSGIYRCFIYNEIKDPVIQSRIRPDEVVGYNVSVSISETATCAGLRNPTSGSLSLTLYAAPKDQPPCPFPTWLNTKTSVWTSLDHHFTLSGTEKGSEMLFKDFKDSRRRGDPHNLGKFTCLEAVQSDGDDVVILAREIIGCNGQDVCITLSTKSDSISNFDLHFKDDSLTQPDFRSACLNRTFLDSVTNFQTDHREMTLIEEKAKSEPCPISGGYLLSGFYKHDNKYLGKDCKSSNPMMWPPQQMLAGQGKYQDVVKFVSGDCHAGDEEGEPVAQCLGSWQDPNNTINLILTFVTSNDTVPIHYCFSFEGNNTSGYILVHASTKHCPGVNPYHNELAFYMHNCGDCVDQDEMTESNRSLKLGSSGISPSFPSSRVTIVLVLMASFFLQ
ncbi:hypothetical protein Fcan01_24619 [Folsomia candida]|uniref:Uncharacterized protein n=1 Tax=Folsomia candida TaxID=158441 RepID=A0A226D4U0_FOLCA|nr:hypothetical protein Fcan01_24619 [Folsomia candida]